MRINWLEPSEEDTSRNEKQRLKKRNLANGSDEEDYESSKIQQKQECTIGAVYCDNQQKKNEELQQKANIPTPHTGLFLEIETLRWMVPVFRFFEYVNFERKEQKVNSTS